MDRIVEFADLPWSRQAFEDVFIRNGWHATGEDGSPVVGWLEYWPLGADHDEDWHLVLGEHPGCRRTRDRDRVCAHPDCRTDCAIVLPLAYAAIDVTSADGGPAPLEDYWDLDVPPQAQWSPDASWEDFEARFTAAEQLLHERLGDPCTVADPLPEHQPERALTWQRGQSLITLFTGSNHHMYGLYDWTGIDVRPAVAALPRQPD